MAVISGIGGSVTFSGGYAVNVRSWNVSLSAESIETTVMAPTASYRTRMGGLKSWSGSYSTFLDDTVLPDIDDKLGGAAATATFQLTDGSGPNIEGSIIITDIAVTATTDSAVEVEFTFEGSAAPTLASS